MFQIAVSVYQGAAALINSSTYLTDAAGILAVEAYHAGSIREQLIQNGSYIVEPYGVTVDTIVDVSPHTSCLRSQRMPTHSPDGPCLPAFFTPCHARLHVHCYVVSSSERCEKARM